MGVIQTPQAGAPLQPGDAQNAVLKAVTDELQDKALEIASRLATGAPAATRLTKYALNNWLRMAGPAFDASTAYEFLGFAGDEAVEHAFKPACPMEVGCHLCRVFRHGPHRA